MTRDCPSCGAHNEETDKKCVSCSTTNPDITLEYPSSEDLENGERSTSLEYPRTQSFMTCQGKEQKEWPCDKCTFLNSTSKKCEMCHNPKTNGSISPMKCSGYASAGPSKDWCDLKDEIPKDMTNVHELRIVLIGRTGCGKSATGNSILGENKFEAMVSGSSVTANCSRGETLRDNRLILVVDTPGLFDTNKLNFEVTKEIGKCIGMTSPGPHAVILVIGIGRYTKEEQDTVHHFLQHFGSDVSRYMMIVFTREDSLTREKITIKDFLKGAPPELKEIVEKCKNRYVAMDNLADESTKKAKVDEIISKIDEMVKDNGGICYTNAMYEAAEKILEIRMKQIREEFEQEQADERTQFKQEISSKYEGNLKRLQDEKSKLEDRLARMQWEKDNTETEKQSIQRKMAQLQSTLRQGTDTKNKEKLQKQLESLRQRESRLTQELQMKERQHALLSEDLDKAKHGVKRGNYRRRRDSVDFDRTVRTRARDDVEKKSGNIFADLLESLKRVGKTFLSQAITFFTKLF